MDCDYFRFTEGLPPGVPGGAVCWFGCSAATADAPRPANVAAISHILRMVAPPCAASPRQTPRCAPCPHFNRVPRGSFVARLEPSASASKLAQPGTATRSLQSHLACPLPAGATTASATIGWPRSPSICANPAVLKRMMLARNRNFRDSRLEWAGFEVSVPVSLGPVYVRLLTR